MGYLTDLKNKELAAMTRAAFDKLSPNKQKQYLKAHPNSKFNPANKPKIGTPRSASAQKKSADASKAGAKLAWNEGNAAAKSVIDKINPKEVTKNRTSLYKQIGESFTKLASDAKIKIVDLDGIKTLEVKLEEDSKSLGSTKIYAFLKALTKHGRENDYNAAYSIEGSYNKGKHSNKYQIQLSNYEE